MSLWLLMEKFVYFDVTPNEKKIIYDNVQNDYAVLLDLLYIMRKRAEEETMGDCAKLAQMMEKEPDKETFEVGYIERDPKGSYGKLRGFFDDETKLSEFVDNFNKYLNKKSE